MANRLSVERSPEAAVARGLQGPHELSALKRPRRSAPRVHRRENMVKFWLSIQTLRELYSQIPKDSVFGHFLFEERKRQLLIYKEYLKSNEDKATQMAVLLGLQLLYPAASPDLESVVRSVSNTANTILICTILYLYVNVCTVLYRIQYSI